MLSLVRTLSRRYWGRRRTRAALAVCSVALGVATWMATSALTASLGRAIRQAAAPPAGAADLYVTNGDAGVPWDLAAELTAVPGVHTARPLVLCRVLLPDLGPRPALLLGVDVPTPDDAAAADVEIEDLAPPPGLRDLLLGRKSALVGRELAQALPADAGGFNVLIAGRVHRLARAGIIARARGPAAHLAGNVLVLPAADAASLMGRPELASRFDLVLEPGADAGAVAGRVAQRLGNRAQVATPEGHDLRTREALQSLTIAFTLCGTGALAVGLFLIYNALAVGVAERRHDIGVLRSLGATRGQVCRLFLGEAGLLGLTGAVLGLPLGLGLAQLALGPMHRVLSDLYLPLDAGRLEITPGMLLGATAAGLAATLLAALAPAVEAAVPRPVEALRRLPAFAASGRLARPAGAVLALALLGAVAVAGRGQLPPRVGTFGGLVLLLAAGFLAVPFAAAGLARLTRPVARHFLGVPGRLAVENLVRARGRLGVVIAAVAAGVALLVQTAGVIRSNEAAVRKWVEQSVAGDLFVTAGGPLSASGQVQPMHPAVGRLVEEALPGTAAVPFRFRHLDWRQAGRMARVLLVALDASRYHAVYAGRPQPPPDLELFRQLGEQPDTALVSANFAALHGVRAGDRLTLPGTEGPVTLRVLGTVVDFSCSRGTVFVDRARDGDRFDAGLADVFSVCLPPGADAEALRERVLQSSWGTNLALCALTHDELRGHILGMVERLYGLAYTQELIVAVVAVLGVVAALLIAVLQRRRELGLLRAVGATRGQVFSAVLAEAALLGVLGTALGLLAGLPLEWYTVRVLLFEDSGFLAPVQVPWAVAAVVSGLAVASATLAGLGPAWSAVRPAITEAIAFE
jgi:putative ABC transport system permease protein